MTAGVLNYPRRVLSERESIIREALERFGAASSGSVSVVKLTGDVTISTSTLTDVTNLYFRVRNGKYYDFRFTVLFQTDTATDGVSVGLTVPGVTRYGATVSILWAADGATALWSGPLTSSGDSVTCATVLSANTDYVATITGVIVPSADGSVQVQAAAKIGSPNVKVRQGSFGTLTTG